MNEGGGGSLKNGKPFLQAVQATEKAFTNFTLTVKNPGGHSSVPRPDNAIYQLAEGLVRFEHFKFPVQLNDVTRAFFAGTAEIETPANAAAMRALLKNPGKTHGRCHAVEGCALQLDSAHDVRGDAAERRPRGQRAPADGDGARELPRVSERADRLGTRDASSRSSPTPASWCRRRRSSRRRHRRR